MLACLRDELSGWGAARTCILCVGTALVEELDKLLMVQLRDGRKIMGILRYAGPCSSATVDCCAMAVCDTRE
jgi:hypothetical protein